ncbi:aldolase/citrate lyase family protein [Mangrovimonas sp. AS39]|uniref:aldolase/citrate lyase family protein n=1 Tax=Mangrovimonas futianensis TaxID=2895523 RepID=UPI001E325A58|nr:aldolase/citrate lyase family protein [Mangrovimonas futianensis]MCF1190822.1 aldolase/citrate lyase family protein [Mangrovimonas futianensis]MCF1194519.1 aldolase/citrate lyase family protein [Mangrovimonas futianensis]
MKLFLFTTDLTLAQKAEDAGVESVLVDWERKGKAVRQSGHNLEINQDSPDDVKLLADNLNIPVTVRVNPIGYYTKDEVNLAIDCGAKVIMLPMSKSVKDVERFLKIIDNRTETLVQIETPELVNKVGELNKLPWDYAHVGLNDLMVAKGNRSIWEAVADGTVEEVCSKLEGKKFGFGGVTVLGGGTPIPFNLILNEMVRLGCSMGILRRSFKAEILDRDFNSEIEILRMWIKSCSKRGEKSIQHDHELLKGIIKKYI